MVKSFDQSPIFLECAYQLLIRRWPDTIHKLQINPEYRETKKVRVHWTPLQILGINSNDDSLWKQDVKEWPISNHEASRFDWTLD